MRLRSQSDRFNILPEMKTKMEETAQQRLFLLRRLILVRSILIILWCGRFSTVLPPPHETNISVNREGGKLDRRDVRCWPRDRIEKRHIGSWVFILMVGMHVPKRIITFNSIFCSINGWTKNKMHRKDVDVFGAIKTEKQSGLGAEAAQRSIDRLEIGTNVECVHKTFNCFAINDLLRHTLHHSTSAATTLCFRGRTGIKVGKYLHT